jgi:zinc protease
VFHPSAPFGHPDSFALQVVAGTLNGRTGRLHRDLVLDDGIAYSASVLQHPLRRAGYFVFSAETRGDTDPARLVAAWESQARRLAEEPIPAAELDKVKAQIAADAWRRLKDPEDLLRQLLIYSGLGNWRQINDWPDRVLAVTAEQASAAARRHLTPKHRTVALYRRQPTAAATSAADVGPTPKSVGGAR